MRSVYTVWGKHPGDSNGYSLGVAEDDEGALELAMRGIAERVDGEWDEYRRDDIETFRRFVGTGHYAKALEHWNDNMSGFQITINEVPLLSTHGGQIDFCWPEEPCPDLEPDWLLLEIKDKGPDEYYRYAVKLANMSATPIGDIRYWSVRDLDDPRYAPHPSAPSEVASVLARARVH